MFKSIQDKIIFSNPLLWNIKLIPMLIVLAIFHTIVFFIGYFHGTIDLEYSLLPHRDKEGTFIIIMSLIMFLIFILWIYFYMRNNAFEHFYPKKALDIYKEWLLILLITFLIVGFPITYFFGKETKIRSYISKEKLLKEVDILKKASFFMQGEYNFTSYKFVNDLEKMEEYSNKIELPKTAIKINRDSILYNGKNYPYYSIFNKSFDGVYYDYEYNNDSIIELKVKKILENNDIKSLKNIFTDYLLVQQKYKHKNNLNDKKWFELVYNFPFFEEKIFVGTFKNSEENLGYGYTDQEAEIYVDETNYINLNEQIYDKIFKNSVKNYRINDVYHYKYNYFTDFQNTRILLNIFFDAHNNKECNFMLFFGLFYFAGFLSLILFLYKMTQWKNWLISIISGVIIAIVIGIVAAIIDRYFMNRYEGILIGTIIILLFLVVFGFFLFTIYKSKSKKFSGVLLGLSLPVIVSIFPLIVFFVFDTIKEFSGYNDDVSIDRDKFYPWVSFFNDLLGLVPFLNIIFVIVMMYFMSFWIKKWKSLPEA